MRYISTRDPGRTSICYEQAIIQGLAPDGGLYIPENIPKLALAKIKHLSRSYAELSWSIQQLFIDEDSIPAAQLKQLLAQAYSPENFPRTKESDPVTPLEHIDGDIFIEELSFGPTAAFKDMALQSLGRQLEYVLRKRGERLRIVGATSGDTGSAAESPFVKSDSVQVFMLSPHHGMSTFQKAQMAGLSGPNIFNLAVKGSFDDCQDLVKQLKLRPRFEDIGALNSINWGRVVAQIPYYFSAFLQLMDDNGKIDEFDVVVPSGNFGNILAGHYARRLGLPIKTLIIATNENNVLNTLAHTGVYREKPTISTSSPSMDISKSSNFERLLHEIHEGNARRVAEDMQQFSTTGSITMPSPESVRSRGFDSGSSTAQERLEAIRWVYETTKKQRIIDPHTADGVTVARRYTAEQKNKGRPVVVLSTALPVKFEPTIEQALGFVPPRPRRFLKIEDLLTPNAFTTINNDIDQLAEFVRTHSFAR